MSTTIESLQVRITGNAAPLRRELQRTQGSLTTFSNSIRALATGAIALGIARVGASIVRIAADAEEANQKFGVVFGQGAEAVRQWGEEVAKVSGKSRQDLTLLLSAFQDLIYPILQSRDAAAVFSKQFSQVAIDLASFNNSTVDTALRKLRAGLVGSAEPLLEWGIDVRKAAVNQEILNSALDASTPRLRKQAELQARLNIILRDGADAIGDNVRSTGTFVKETGRLEGALADLAATVGADLLPALASSARELAKFFNLIEAFYKTPYGRSFFADVGSLVKSGAATLVGISPATRAFYELGFGEDTAKRRLEEALAKEKDEGKAADLRERLAREFSPQVIERTAAQVKEEKRLRDKAKADADYKRELEEAAIKEYVDRLDRRVDEEQRAIAESSKAMKEFIASITESLSSNLGTAFADIIVSGRNAADAIGDAFKRIAYNFVQEQAQKGISTLLSGLIGGIGGLGGGGTSLIPTVGGNQLGFAPNVALPGLASGGAVAPGKSYLVGEKGPEIFRSKSSGVIIPNGQGGGSPNIYFNYNIQRGVTQASLLQTLRENEPRTISNVASALGTDEGFASQFRNAAN